MYIFCFYGAEWCGVECWERKKQEAKIYVAGMCMLRWMSGGMRKDRNRNVHIRENFWVA